MSEAAEPQELAGRLLGGERLVWWDKPDPGASASREANSGLLFGLFFLCFSLFWISQAASAGGIFFLFGVPFVLVGVWIVTAPVRAYRRAAGTFFALTDRRALVMQGPGTKAFPLEHVAFVESESGHDGIGHVLFYDEQASPFPSGFNNQATRKSGFLAVRDPERVAATMLELIEARRTGGTPS